MMALLKLSTGSSNFFTEVAGSVPTVAYILFNNFRKNGMKFDLNFWLLFEFD